MRAAPRQWRGAVAIVLWGCAPGPVPHAPPPTAAVVSVPAPAPAPPPAPTCATASLHWRASDPLPFSPGRYAIEEDGTLWILDGDDRLHRSRDRGATFDDQPIQLPDTMEEEEAFVRDLAARQGVVFIAAIDAVYRSEDGGATLERAWAGPLNIGGHMTYSPLESLWTDGDALYVLENQGEVQRSRDGGLRWSHVPGPGETSRYAFHEMTGNRDGFRYITAGPDELLVSTDGDMTWSMKPMPPEPAWTLTAGAGANVVAVGSKGAVISRDAGSSWTPIDVEGAVYSATWGPCPDEWTLQTEDGIFHRTKGTPFTPEKWTGPRSMQLRALRRTTTGAVGLAVHLSPHGDADQLFVVTGR